MASIQTDMVVRIRVDMPRRAKAALRVLDWIMRRIRWKVLFRIEEAP